MATYYNVFHRTWWIADPNGINGRNPGVGKKHYIRKHVTLEDARRLCAHWNKVHDPGPLSDKAEFEEA